jgi:hypothetical protein
VPHTYRIFFDGRAVPFSGQLLLARGFDCARYVHMGFQSPSAYRDIRRVTLRAGRVTEARALTRAQVKRCSLPKDAGGSGRAVDWIRACFALDFADPGNDD